MSGIEVAKDLIKLRNQDREEGEEDQYYSDFYNIDILKLEELFFEISNGSRELVNKENIQTIGLAWFLVAYELGRAHQTIIDDLGE